MSTESNQMESTGCERLDWDTAEEHPEVAGGFILVVRGVAPVPTKVKLHPLPIGIAPEDYQGVEVCGEPEDPTIEVETPWTVEEDTSKLPRGRVGYVLIGATKRAYFPPREDSAE